MDCKYCKKQIYLDDENADMENKICGSCNTIKKLIDEERSSFCICEHLTIFDTYVSDYPDNSNRCNRCGKVIDKIKMERILNSV